MRLIPLVFICLFLYPHLAFSKADQELQTLCQKLYEKQKEGADYIPSVDVHGKKVASADLNSNSTLLDDPIIIPVEIDLVQKYGLALPPEIGLKPEITKIKIMSNGRIRFGDQDISEDLEKLCSTELKNDTNDIQGHGHKAPDTVRSSIKENDKIEGQYPEESKPRYNN